MINLFGMVRVLNDQPYLKQALLHGFDVNMAELKPCHRYWLDQYAKPMRRPGLTAMVHGHTSTTGSDALNLALSERRAAAVAQYLEGLAPAVPLQATTSWDGEQTARVAGLADGVEHSRWRGVLVTLIDLSRIPKPPPPPPPRMVQRKASVELKVSEEEKGYGIGRSEPGAKSAHRGEEFARYAFEAGTMRVTHQLVDERWRISTVTLTKKEVDSMGLRRVSTEYVTVSFGYEALGPQRQLIDQTTGSSTTEELSLVDLERWYRTPMKAMMRRKYWLGKVRKPLLKGAR